MAKRAKGSPRTGRALWLHQSNWPEGTPYKRPHPYGRRPSWGGYGRGRVRGEIPPMTDTDFLDEEDTSPPEGFKQGGSVKVRGSGIATQGVRPAKMVKMKGS